MTPPQLTGNTPVLNIVQPLVIGICPVFRYEFDFAVIHFFQRDFRNRFAREESAFRCRFAHCHKPLVGQHRFNHDACTVAARHHQFVRFDFCQQALCIQISNHALTGFEAIHAAIGFRRVVTDFGIQRQDGNHFQLMALANGVIVEIMCRCDFHAAGTESFIHIGVSNHRNFTACQWQFQQFANQRTVAGIGRIHRDRDVTQQGFRTGGCNYDVITIFPLSGIAGFIKCDREAVAAAIRKRIADMPHGTVFFLGNHFQIGYGCAEYRVPVNQTFATVNQTLFHQTNEYLCHRF